MRVAWSPIVIFPDPSAAHACCRPSTREHTDTGVLYAYWFEDADSRVVFKVGRTIRWRTREKSIFSNILDEYRTLPRVFAVVPTSRLTRAEDRLVDRMQSNRRFRLYKGLEWFELISGTIEDAEAEVLRAIRASVDA